MTQTLTSDQLASFDRDGFAIVPEVFTAAECDEILEHLERTAFELALGDAAAGPLSYRPMMHLASEPLLRVATDPRWAGIVLPIVGPDARLYWEQGVAKPPQAGTELPWHQDNGYAPTIPEQYLTCWLALDDATADNGGLWVRPGSHRVGTVPHHDVAGSPFRSTDAGDDPGVAVPVERGGVLCFSSLILHRSGPNITDRPRRSWILQYCPAHAVHARTGELLDDRLRVSRDGRWLDEPVRERAVDLRRIVANYERDPA